jgi:hypothetical protein
MRLKWEKQSHMRYSAMCGPGRVEVRKVWHRRYHWTVGEVFGRHHHSSSRYPCSDRMSLEEAKVMAERVAADMIFEFRNIPNETEEGS